MPTLLNLFLICTIAYNLISIIFYAYMLVNNLNSYDIYNSSISGMTFKNTYNNTDPTLNSLCGLFFGFLNLVWSVAILKGKKWGFYVFLISNVANFVIQFYNGMISVGVILNVIILCLLLNIGKNKARSQLE